MEKTYLVETITHRKTGLLVAMSDDLDGLLVHGRTEDELDQRIPIAIKALLEARGEKVGRIIRLDDDDDVPVAFAPSRAHYTAEPLAA